jgi:hypothetical protein
MRPPATSVRGRRPYLGCRPGGTWWRLRLFLRRCTTTVPAGWEDAAPDGWDDAPPDGGVREPRRPHGDGPLTGAVRLPTSDA